MGKKWRAREMASDHQQAAELHRIVNKLAEEKGEVTVRVVAKS